MLSWLFLNACADDWLVGHKPEPPTLTEGTLAGIPTLTLSNGLISRVFALPGKSKVRDANYANCPNPGGRMGVGFATVSLSRLGHTGLDSGSSSLSNEFANLLRTSSAEAIVKLNGKTYNLGGLVGQTDYAFLNSTLLGLGDIRADPDAFVYLAHRTGEPAKRFDWTPGMRHSDATLTWPPRGLTLEVDFGPPATTATTATATTPSTPTTAAAPNVTVTVVYELYEGLPVYSKWVKITANSAVAVTVDELTTDLLYATNEAMGYWPHGTYGSLTSASDSGRVHMQSEMSRGGDTTRIMGDDRCQTCVGGNGLLVLNSSYPLGPGAELSSTSTAEPSTGKSGARGQGFHGRSFESFRTYVLVHDSDDGERRGLAMRRMYRTLAPQVTENPIFMHLTDTSPEGIKKAVDQCKAVGFEMIILSFGSGLNMESKDPLYINRFKKSVDYAHSQGIQIGGYNLMSSSRTVAKGGNCLGPDGKPNGASCLASDWSDNYFDTIQNFINTTGFDMIETDGPYEGHTCTSTTHAHHLGLADSIWTQYERNMKFYEWCRARGMYIHAPDPYYMRGINKDGMGYVETNWNLPLWEQINLARQNIYDGTWAKVPSQGWMFVPLVQYHGGWPECCIEPVGFLAGQWEWYLAMYFFTGVSPCYRGTRLYDEKIPASKALVQKYTALNNQYRSILHADLIHLKRADGYGIDGMLHVQPDASKSKERAFLVVFNQNPQLSVNTTLRVPLYYVGLDTTATVTRGDAGGTLDVTGLNHSSNTPKEQLQSPQTYTLARDWTISLPLSMAPNSVAWFVVE